ncbi:serine hydrolase [Shimia sp. R10_1]|uniref:serine hydrolase domain-containing protein n=1 Tax=Shimia sp. R10_1 TaxID=2821095 RepID=UPI001ADBC79A|nr:serine hydrolase [Shimia sp. R10_1]MBO9473480.1 serine hydrolase [Shimia sp. R10_1]
MRRFGKWLGRILLMLALAVVAVYFLKREEITRLLAVNSLFSEEKIVSNFSNMDTLFLTADIAQGDTAVSPLPIGTAMQMPDRFDSWLKERAVTSVVVLKDGAVVHESYHQDTAPEDLKISWSVAKSYLSSLMGIVLAEGHIESLDDPVTKYAPLLKGSAYDGATIKNVLQMSSGVTFNEDYLDFHSDINRMGRVLALGGTLDGFAAGLSETFVAPGTQFQYVSIDTHVIGMVIRGATGRSIPDLMSEKIISKLGYEESPYYVTDGEGVAFVLGGLNIRTRDYARFGQMILQEGQYGDEQIVPADWLAAATVPSANTQPGKLHYGYQWWMPKDPREGEFFGIGVYGQYIYINRTEGVVIAVNSADRKFKDSGVTDGNIALFREIADTAR